MAERKLTPKQEQARLQAASNCSNCKRIWDSFSDDFCDAHSVAGWQGLSPATDSPQATSKKSEKGDLNKWFRRARITVITIGIIGGLTWCANMLDPEGGDSDKNRTTTTAEPVETTVVDDMSWVPVGMQLVDGSDEVAFRYLRRAEVDCSTGGITCLGVEIVTKTDCRFLFAYLRWTDFGGFEMPFDSSTDSKGVTDHRARVRLQLIFKRSDPLGAITSGRIDSVDCL